jgi:Fe-Mn family superoxide dismutase
MAFDLAPLPYEKSALEPHMSAKTLDFHHDKHHRSYVDGLNELVKGTAFATTSLEAIITETARNEAKATIFNDAAQAWNHAFFWTSMKPNGGGRPTGDFAARIDRDFGSLAKFKEQFKQTAIGQFGSGWAWLVIDKNELKVTKTANAMTPLALGQTALLACDVWEHAYYLDYQKRRPDFVQAFLDHLVNWESAAKILAGAA